MAGTSPSGGAACPGCGFFCVCDALFPCGEGGRAYNRRVDMSGLPFEIKWSRLPDLPDAEGFAGSYAGVHGGALLVAGGANFPEKPMWEGGAKRWTDRVFVLPGPEEGWREPARLPKPMGYGASACLPHGVLLVGGSNAGGALNDVCLLSWKDGALSCTEWPSLPVALTGHAAAVLDGVVYVMGGSLETGEQDAEARMWKLDAARLCRGWQECEPLPGRGRFLHQMAAAGDAVYVLGGIGVAPGGEGRMVRDMLRDAWSYTIDRGWRRLADLPYSVAAAPTPAPVRDGRVYLFGGDDASVKGFTPQNHPGFHSQSLCYTIAADEWTACGSVPAARAVLPCAFWNGLAVIVNGEQRPGKRSNQVWGAHL